MLSDNPLISVCIIIEGDEGNFRSTVASALRSCPNVPHEVLLATKGMPSGWINQIVEGERILGVRLISGIKDLWDFLKTKPKGRILTVIREAGVISGELPEKAFDILKEHSSAIIVPKIGIYGLDGFWQYGCELTPDLSLSPMFRAPESFPEVPATRLQCFSCDRQRIADIVEYSIVSWNHWIAPQEISLRWWLTGGEILCDVTSWYLQQRNFRYSYDPKQWLRDRLQTAILHLSLDRVKRINGYFNRLYPMEYLTVIKELDHGRLWTLRHMLEGHRVRDDDWFFDKFDCEIMPRPIDPL